MTSNMATINGVKTEFVEGTTLANALVESGIDIEAPMLITVNGKLLDKSLVYTYLLPDDADILTMSVLSGG